MSRTRLVLLNAVGLVVIGTLAGLGTWQVQRRAWKLDLIARVEARVHAVPVPAPGPAEWAGPGEDQEAYRHVRATGRFLPVRPALVQAVTDLGAGYWVLAPLRTQDGFTVLVNRGFVPPGRRDPADWPDAGDGLVDVTGLLRLSEPGGGFLRANDPSGDRWYSRDVAAIARARGLDERAGPVAPYFIDAERGDPGTGRATGPGDPVPGLTVLAFPNNHLVYALTWYTMSAMALAGLVVANRTASRGDRHGAA